ncbi:MAG: ankyrin repeat domain-containing protein [Candidatus Thiodiazotropha sp. 6PDIVS]
MKYPILSSFITIFGILLVTGCNTTQPLHIAALDGDLAMVRDLSSKGNSINQKYTVDPTYQGFTPLHMAINNGHKDVALYLIPYTL